MESIEQMLRQAELTQKNLELDLMFTRNMEFFQEASPEIYKQFRNYTPTKLQLAFTEDSYVNLLNLEGTKGYVYNKEPVTFCREYIEKYTEMPTAYRITARTTKAIDVENDAHIHHMNPLIEYMNSREVTDRPQILEESTQFMLVLGIGMGFHIPMLLEKTDVRHMCILEPHNDNFYASLHCIDWRALYHAFDRQRCTLNLVLGQTAHGSFELIRRYLNQIGLFNSVRPYVFDHLSSPEMKEATSVFFDKLPTMIGAMGYFDDEQVSLSHTVANYRNEIPILRDHVQLNHKTLATPVFVCANGPSLDNVIEFLRAHHNEVVIISCGTALGSLAKAGIKPDFHVEMERTRPTVEWIEASTTPEFRKDIICLGLNTVHPDTFDLFETRGMGMKSNDLGTHFICQYIGEDQFLINLALSNPTVGNTGMAFAAALGFSEIYIAGLDLGFAADGQHHSSLSKHYDVKDEHQEGLNLYKADATGNKKLPGNFGGEIISTSVYAHARISVETLLRQYPHIKCYNTSNGVFIRGSTPTPIDDVQIPTGNIDKAVFCRDLYSKYFHTDGLKKISSNEEVANHFKPAMAMCEEFAKLFRHKVKTRADAFDLLSTHHEILLRAGMNPKHQYAYSILKGSVHSFNFVLAKCLYNGNTIEEGIDIFNVGVDYYQRFLKQAVEKMKSSLLEKDKRSRNLATKLKS